MLTDETLMRKFCLGDAEAFQLLFERYRDRLFRFIHVVYVRDYEAAADCTQETFIRVVRKRDSYDPERRFSSWLYTIARNLCLNWLRDHGNDADTNVAVTPEATGPQQDPRRLLEGVELEEKMRQAVEALPEHFRAVFLMREVDGLPHAEVAAALGLSEGAVRTQLHRAKRHLRETLTPYLRGQ